MSPPLTLAQGAIPSAPLGATNPYEYRLRCQAPNPSGNPYKRKFGCKDVHFDTKETLSDDWTDARSALRDEGITPTASHVAALQTNPGGMSRIAASRKQNKGVPQRGTLVWVSNPNHTSWRERRETVYREVRATDSGNTFGV
jgi:hypothetical protein